MGKKKNIIAASTALSIQSLPVKSNNSAVSSSNGDVDETSDLESLYSSVAGDESDDESDLQSQIDSFSDFIDGAFDKRIGIRSKALDSIISILKKCTSVVNLQPWVSSLLEIIEKNLKRSLEESTRACILAALLAIQFGPAIEEQISSLANCMKSICLDPTANEILRTICIQSLGVCVYISVDHFATRYECLLAMQNIWSSFRPSAPGSTSLFVSALYSWSLLLKKFNSSIIRTALELQPKLCSFLESSTVESRISVGETMAILYEIAVSDVGDDFQFKNHEYLECILTDLSQDSSKFRAKRDRKIQRLSFRQIIDRIFHNKTIHFEIRFSKREKIMIESCHTKLFYDLLCKILQGNLNRHLSKNEVLRTIFELGSSLDEENKQLSKAEKVELMNQYGEISKQRKIQRSKFRTRKQGNQSDFLMTDN